MTAINLTPTAVLQRIRVEWNYETKLSQLWTMNSSGSLEASLSAINRRSRSWVGGLTAPNSATMNMGGAQACRGWAYLSQLRFPQQNSRSGDITVDLDYRSLDGSLETRSYSYSAKRIPGAVRALLDFATKQEPIPSSAV